MTLDLLRQWLGGGLALAGGVFMLIGAIGLIRMPDVFTRMHAASVSDTLGAGLILVGLMVLAGASLVTVKLVFLVLFFGLLSPVATHAVARAALHAGVKPVLAEGVEAETISEEAVQSKP
ncbi:MAG: monovalent cation/H(+) antiporter subunit G [Bauldia sp.]